MFHPYREACGWCEWVGQSTLSVSGAFGRRVRGLPLIGDFEVADSYEVGWHHVFDVPYGTCRIGIFLLINNLKGNIRK